MVKFKDFSRPLSFFKYFSRQILFSRTFQDSPVYSSTFRACMNPGAGNNIVVNGGKMLEVHTKLCGATDGHMTAGLGSYMGFK